MGKFVETVQNKFPTRLTTSFTFKYLQLVDYFHMRCNPIPLALFRILFGFLMFLDVFQERGLNDVDIRFGDPNYCFFNLFDWIQPPAVQQACILYSIMWAGRNLSWVIRNQTFDNHPYDPRSIDALCMSKQETAERKDVPKWNYFILKFQIFLLYFYAGVKKLTDSDWVNGYSMKNLSRHAVFSPLKLFTDAETIDYYMVHMGGLIYDLTVGFMLNFDFAKKTGYLLSFMFHGLNSQLFQIGMFPYVCLASLILFCKPDEFPCSLLKQQQPEAHKETANMRRDAEWDDL